MRAVRGNLLHASHQVSCGFVEIFDISLLINVLPQSQPSALHVIIPLFVPATRLKFPFFKDIVTLG